MCHVLGTSTSEHVRVFRNLRTHSRIASQDKREVVQVQTLNLIVSHSYSHTERLCGLVSATLVCSTKFTGHQRGIYNAPQKGTQPRSLFLLLVPLDARRILGFRMPWQNVLMYRARSAVHSVCALGKAWELCCGALTGQSSDSTQNIKTKTDVGTSLCSDSDSQILTVTA